MMEAIQFTEHVEYFNPLKITIKKYLANGKTFVKTDEFRTFPSLSHQSLADWRNDTAFLTQLLSNTNLDYDDYVSCLSEICSNHIRKYGRLIDTDLYNYIDDILLIIKAGVGLDGTVFPVQVGRDEWSGFQKAMLSRFPNNIWVHQRSSNPLLGVQLVRFADINAIL